MAILTVKQYGAKYSTLKDAVNDASDGDTISIEGPWTVDDTSACTVSVDLTIVTDSESMHPGYPYKDTGTWYRLRPDKATTGHAFTWDASCDLTMTGVDVQNQSSIVSAEIFRIGDYEANSTCINCLLGFDADVDQQDILYYEKDNTTSIFSFIQCCFYNVGRSIIDIYDSNTAIITINLNSCLSYNIGAKGARDAGAWIGMYSGSGTYIVNMHNCLCSVDDSYLFSFGAVPTITVNVDDSIVNLATTAISNGEDNEYIGSGVVGNYTFTNDVNPGAGNYIIHENITTDSIDLRLVNNPSNDALNFHSTKTGQYSNLTIPGTDMLGNPRPYGSNSFNVGPLSHHDPPPYNNTLPVAAVRQDSGHIKPPRGTTLNKSHPLSEKLEHCLLFNEATGSTVNDSTDNGLVGTIGAASSWNVRTDGPGVESGFEIQPISLNKMLVLSLGKTVEFIITTGSSISGQRMFAGENDADNYFSLTGGGTELYIQDNDSSSYGVSYTFQASTRYHIIIVHSPDRSPGQPNDFCMYINGIYMGSDGGEAADYININTLGHGWNTTTYNYLGSMHLFRIWDRELSDADIMSLYREPYQMFTHKSIVYAPQIPTDGAAIIDRHPTGWQKPPRGTTLNKSHPMANGLAGAWIMNEGTGEILFDHGGKFNFHRWQNSPEWVADGIRFTQGDGDYIKVDLHGYITPGGYGGDFSIVAGIRTTTDNDYLFMGESGSTSKWRWHLNNGMRFYPESGSWSTETTAVNDGNIHNIVLTHETTNGVTTQYVDGMFETSDDINASGIWYEMYIAAFGGSAWYTGDVHYVYFFDRILSNGEVASLHANPYQMFSNQTIIHASPETAAAKIDLSPVVQKPLKGITLNTDNPLSKGLTYCLPLNDGTSALDGSAFDHINKEFTTPHSTYPPTWRADGLDISQNNGSNNTYFSSKTLMSSIIKGSGTVFVIMEQSYATIPSSSYLITDPDTWNEVSIITNYNSHTTKRLYLGLNSVEWTSSDGVTDDLVLGEEHSTAFTWDDGIDERELYQDGISRGIKTTSFTVSDRGYVMQIGSNGASGHSISSILKCMYIYDRRLTTEEIISLHKNPYQVFQMPPTIISGHTFEKLPEISADDNLDQSQALQNSDIAFGMPLDDKAILGTELNEGHPLSIGLELSYIFNEFSGTTATDQSNGRDGLIQDATWSSEGVDFNGTDSLIQINNFNQAFPIDDNTNHTIIIGYEYDNAPTGYATLYNHVATSSSDVPLYMLIQSSNGRINNWEKCYATMPTGWDSGWHSIAYSHASGAANANDSFYFDGEKIATTGLTGDRSATSQTYALIGNATTGNDHEFDGRIAYIHIWNRVLSETEIASVQKNPYQMYDSNDKVSTPFTPTVSADLTKIQVYCRTVGQPDDGVRCHIYDHDPGPMAVMSTNPAGWQKPPRGMTLNKIHPSAKDLAGCFIFNEKTGEGVMNHADGTVATLQVEGTGSLADWGAEGYDFENDGNNGKWFSADTESFKNIGDGAFTVAWKLVINRAFGQTYCPVICFDTYDPFWGHRDQNNGRLFYYDGSDRNLLPENLEDDHSHHLALSRAGGGSTELNGYHNGTLSDIDDYALNASSLDDPLVVSIGWGGSGDMFLDNELSYLYFWKRELTPGEIASIHRNPYQIFQAPSPTIIHAPDIPKKSIARSTNVIKASDMNVDDNLYNFTFDSTTLSSGTTYWIVLTRTGSQDQDNYYVTRGQD